MIANLSIMFRGIKIATTQRNLLQYQKVKNFTFFNPKKDSNKNKSDEKYLNTKSTKIKTNKTQNLDNTATYNFSKNMNQNSLSDKEKIEKAKQEANANSNSKKKLLEEQMELNSSRRNLIRIEKERNYKNRISSIEKPDRDCYSAEEFNKLIANLKNSELIFFKISYDYKCQVSSFIKTAVYFIFPLSISGLVLVDFFCSDIKNISILMKFGYYFLISFDYFLFMFGVYLLKKSRNIVVSAKLFPNDSVLEVAKFNSFGKIIRIKERIVDMKLNRNSWLNPDDSIKSKRTNKNYIFKDDQTEVKDKKLFNYLFPEPEVKERKKPSMVDSLWDKN